MTVPLLRTYLYAPGSDAGIMRKALAAGADAVVLDLEDAVAPPSKATARGNIARLLGSLPPGRVQVHVRINVTAEGYDADDLDACVAPGLSAIRLPKAESATSVAEVGEILDDLEISRGITPGSTLLYPTIESAAGAVRIAEIAACRRVARLGYGAADFSADLGLPEPTALGLLHLQGELVLRSRAAGIGAPIDTVFTDLVDDEGLRAAARRARELGFSGKSVIHPRQLDIVHEAFTPTAAEIRQARRVIAAAEAGTRAGHGGVVLDGEFIDAPVVARARAALALWEAAGAGRR